MMGFSMDVDRRRDPPRTARWLLRHLVSEENREFLLGDLDEEFRAEIESQSGYRLARRRYWAQAIRCVVQRRAPRKIGMVSPGKMRDRFAESFLQDFRYGFRMMLRDPLVTAVAVLTLALGIGATTAILSFVNGVLLRPFDIPQADRIVALWEYSESEGRRSRATMADFLDWQDQSRSFEHIAAFGAAGFNLTGSVEPEQVRGLMVTSEYFRVLGIEPALGRFFLPEENQPGRERVIMLDHGLWLRRFGADRNVIGKTVTLDDLPYTVVGIMPPGLYPGWPTTTAQISFLRSQQQFWVPIPMSSQWSSNRRSHVLGVIGRLRPGVTLGQTQSEMVAIAGRLEQAHPESNRELGILVTPLVDEMVGEVRPALLILLAAVGLVLLIACANISGLLLSRLAARRPEFAVRAALGAGKGRLLRQFLSEGLLLAAFAAALGIWLAHSGITLIMRIIPSEIPGLEHVNLDAKVLGFTVLISFSISLIIGLVSALQSIRSDLLHSLKEGGRIRVIGPDGHRIHRYLVAFQIGLALILVIGTGLLVKSFWRLQQVPAGFDANRVLAVDLIIPQSRYAEWHQVSGFFYRLLERLQGIPGVQSAALSYDHPLEATWMDSFTIEGRPIDASEGTPSEWLRTVSEQYFRTVGVELLRGRSFDATDDAGHPGAVIINEALSLKYFSGEDPIGRRMNIPIPSRMWKEKVPLSFEIVGVVRDVRFRGLNLDAAPAFYVPTLQFPIRDMKVLIRTDKDPLALVPAVRQTVWDLDPDQPVAQIRTLESILHDHLAQPRFNMLLMGLFGIFAVLLAAVGIYGLLSYTVACRTHEIGVRGALGAQKGDILRLMIGQGLGLTLAGLGIGIVGALAFTRFLESSLFGVTTSDPATFLWISAILLAVALLACYFPARRAARVDPIDALRHQ